MEENMQDAKFVDVEAEIKWISERTGIKEEDVGMVLDMDFEYLKETGIIEEIVEE